MDVSWTRLCSKSRRSGPGFGLENTGCCWRYKGIKFFELVSIREYKVPLLEMLYERRRPR